MLFCFKNISSGKGRDKFPTSKSIFLLLFYLPYLALAQSRFFEGIVHYQNQFEINNSNIDPSFLENEYGTSSISYYKNGSHLQLFDRGYLYLQLYRPDLNRVYYQHHAGDTLYYFDAARDDDFILDYQVKKRQDTVLGFVCDELFVRTRNSKRYFYYNRQRLKLDPKAYKKYAFGKKDWIINQMKAIYLRYVGETDAFTVITTAAKIEEKVLSDSRFELPPHVAVKEIK